MFGWVFYTAYKMHPQPLTGTMIHKSLGISMKAATLLKRRFQLFCAQQDELIRENFTEELKQKFDGFNLPPNRNTDLTSFFEEYDNK
jgi:hypothetical protein